METIPAYRIEEIRERVDIVDLIGRYVLLRRAGRDWKGLCPFHSEKTPSFNVNPARKSYKCFGCGAGGDAIRFIMELEGKSFVDTVRMLGELVGVDCRASAEHKVKPRGLVRVEQERQLRDHDLKRIDIVRRIVAESRVIEPGDPVDLYLRGRGLRPLATVWPASLRRALLKHPETKRRHPTMLALVTNLDGETIAIHRTYLTEDGKKAPVSPVKLTFGPLSGGVVRLGIDSEKIAIAEGIESAIAAGMQLGLVPWAAVSAPNMPKIEVPASVKSVTICADFDESGVGEKAALQLRAKLKQLQTIQQRLIDVEILLPPRGRSDFADFG